MAPTTRKPAARGTARKTVAKAAVNPDADPNDGKLPKGHKPPPDNRMRIEIAVEERHVPIVMGLTGGNKKAMEQLAQQAFRTFILAKKRDYDKAQLEAAASARAGI